MDQGVPTITTGIYWIVSKDLPEDLVYEMTKLAYENSDAARASFGQLKVMKPDETAIQNIDIPLHQGAQKFWMEKGVTIPQALQAGWKHKRPSSTYNTVVVPAPLKGTQHRQIRNIQIEMQIRRDR